MNSKYLRSRVVAPVLTFGLLWSCFWLRGNADSGCWQVGTALPDISGLAWGKDGGLFLSVQDLKNNPDKPRVNLLKLPVKSPGVAWCPLAVDWQGKIPQDLEAISAIPASNLFILGGGESRDRRLFLVKYEREKLEVVGTTQWQEEVGNIEGMGVVKLANKLFLLYADRGEGKSQTEIRFAPLSLQLFQIGVSQSVNFSSPEPQGEKVRQISAMELDNKGNIYIASAEDLGDRGPFRSVVWKIGKIQLDSQQKPELILSNPPERLATLDGLKVEGIAIRELEGDRQEILIGTDDENYGGILRLLPH